MKPRGPRMYSVYLERHRALFLDWETRAGGTSPAAYDGAIEGLRAVLNNHTLHGYHCARLTAGEIAHIRSRGMQLPNGAMLRRPIRNLQNSGLINSHTARAFLEDNQADADIRANKIWFCFFAPHIGGESGIRPLLRSWGGEALYRSHDRDPQHGPLLTTIGVPCLVEADVAIASLRRNSFLDVKAVGQFLMTRGCPTTETLEHEDYATWPIPAANIRRFIEFPEPDFVALTRCDCWRCPLG